MGMYHFFPTRDAKPIRPQYGRDQVRLNSLNKAGRGVEVSLTSTPSFWIFIEIEIHNLMNIFGAKR
jgi:hypothetical protein